MMNTTAAIYARYSPGRDRDKSSTIEAPNAICLEKAASEGVAIDENHIYVDRGISGTIQRHDFQALLFDIEAGNFPRPASPTSPLTMVRKTFVTFMPSAPSTGCSEAESRRNG
jgi:hypothetical protein